MRISSFIFLLAAAATVSWFPAEIDAGQPNFLVIMVDDLGYGDLSSYGAVDLQSPHVDELVQAGTRFDFAYANCPVCSPSRASLFTGRYPELVGVPGVIRTHSANNWGYLAADAKLLPQFLKPAGYHTALVGKWHLGLEKPNRPNDRGFDFFHGYLGDMMDDYHTHRRHGINYMHKNGVQIDPKGHATDLFTDWACDYLKSRRGKDEPFCLCLTYNAPHTPIQPPPDWFEKVKARETGISDQRAKLVALIEHLDAGIGKVLATLKQSGFEQNTMVIFTSDNGGQISAGASNGKLRDGKQSMYEGGIRVPTCAVYPGKIRSGSISQARILTMDILPTICEVAGIKVESEIDGSSFWKILKGEQSSMPKRDIYFHRREGGTRYGGLIINAMIRDNQWKLLQNSPFEPQELYNLKVDSLEQTDLANRERQVFNSMAAALRVHLQRGGAVPWQRPERVHTGNPTSK